jgi:hypothetical protein
VIGHKSIANLNRFVDGDLPPWRNARVKAHLAKCARCRERVTAYRRLQSEARKLDREEPPPGLRDRVMESIVSGERVVLPAAPPPANGRGRFSITCFAVVVGALLTVVVTECETGPETGQGVLTRDMPYAYAAVAASNQWFFGLYSGRTINTHDEYLQHGRDVHVFDWSGKFLGCIPLAADARNISVEPEGLMLYALEWDPVPTVSIYPLGMGEAGREQ